MNLPEIRYANESDRNRVLNTITLAFAADPLMRWMLPSADAYLEYYQELTDILAGQSIDSNTCLRTTAFEGAAIWLAPGVKPDEEKMKTLMEKALTSEIGNAMGKIMKQMEEYHPDDKDCWYLAVIGVDPGHQNKGMGSALMKHMTTKLDEKKCLGYLESSNPMNISLYQRHGFEIIGKIQSADSPVVTPMIRPRMT